MELLIVDTDVASYLFKRSPRARRFQSIVARKRTALAFVSVAELYKWSIKRHWQPETIARLEKTLRRKYSIIPFDREMGWVWARVIATCEDAGRPMQYLDAWVAATALRHNLPLVSNNIKHYEAAEELCGLKLIRP